MIPFAIGLRTWWLLAVGILAYIPIQVMVTLITLRLFPVEFEPTGEFRDILFSTDSSVDDPAAVPTAPPQRARLDLGLWEVFRSINQPSSVEGYAIQAGIIVTAACCVWISLVPVFRAVFPTFDTTRSGPKGFPVTVHIGGSTLAVTNESDVNWTCRAELGTERLSGGFAVDARNTATISFTMFDPNRTFEASHIRRAAQDRISLVCTEPSGVSHYADLP